MNKGVIHWSNVKSQRDIKQSCPISGQLFSLAIEPLLCKLRAELKGLSVQDSQSIALSAYADDATVFTKGRVQTLSRRIDMYSMKKLPHQK